MTRASRVQRGVVVAAAVLVAACNSATPSTSGSESASAAASPSVAASAGIAACPETGRAPGTYHVSAEQTLTVPATITITEGWNGCGLLTKDWGPVGGPSLIGFWNVENVYTNPCHWDGALMDPPVGQTAAEFGVALVDQELTEATAPSPATLGGQPATYVRLSVPEDVDVSSCDRVEIAEFRFFKGPGEERTGSSVWWLGAGDAAGLIGEVWATDLDGVRVVVNAAYFSDAAQAEVDEIHAIIESIAFDQ
jgi:hypothetical protein